MKVVLFEDEIHNAERLIQLLQKYNATIEIAAIIPSVSEGAQWMEKNIKVDLILMDIQLSDGNCFELFKQKTVNTPIIFTTAYDNFALQAFKVNSIDYLLKPVDYEELKEALKKFERFRTSYHTVDIAKIADAFLKRDTTRFLVKFNNQLVYVKAKDIAYIQFAEATAYAITNSNQKLPLDYSLDQIEQMLDKSTFFRINRQFIVHIDAIQKISTYHNSRLILKLNPDVGDDVIISRERVAGFKTWLEGREITS
jgi:two-component system, LytTR family, response regulator LytT